MIARLQQARERDDCFFHVLVPASHSAATWTWTEGGDHAAAQARLKEFLAELLETTAWYLPMVIHGLREAMGGRWYGLPPGDVGRDQPGREALQLSLPGLPLCEAGVESPIPQFDRDVHVAGAFDPETAARLLPPATAFGRVD